MRLESQIAIVTGAGGTGGIGEAIARRFVSEGARVVVCDIEAYSRCGPPDEIAAAVLSLACTDSAYVNGAILPVDGGLSSRVACIDAEIE